MLEIFFSHSEITMQATFVKSDGWLCSFSSWLRARMLLILLTAAPSKNASRRRNPIWRPSLLHAALGQVFKI